MGHGSPQGLHCPTPLDSEFHSFSPVPPSPVSPSNLYTLLQGKTESLGELLLLHTNTPTPDTVSGQRRSALLPRQTPADALRPALLCALDPTHTRSGSHRLIPLLPVVPPSFLLRHPFPFCRAAAVGPQNAVDSPCLSTHTTPSSYSPISLLYITAKCLKKKKKILRTLKITSTPNISLSENPPNDLPPSQSAGLCVAESNLTVGRSIP